MEKVRNKFVIALLVIILIIVSALCILFTTGTLSLKTNDEDVNSFNNKEESDDKVNINLLIGNVSVSKDAPNTKILIDGTINLSYNNSKYVGVILSGYCLGTNNEKYHITGPADGRVFFHNDGNSRLTLTESTSQNIEYIDGTFKEWSEIDWENVKIKYCKIDKMTAISNDDKNNLETILNIEKNFN